MTSLSESFNTDYSALLVNSNVLRVSYGRTQYDYDFTARLVLVKDFEGTTKMAVFPFSALDAEVVVAMRDKLVQLGGKPPALPVMQTAQPAPRKLNP